LDIKNDKAILKGIDNQVSLLKSSHTAKFENNISVSFDKYSGDVNQDKPFMVILVEALDNGWISEMISITNHRIMPQVYVAGTMYDLALEFVTDKEEVSIVRVAPNPFFDYTILQLESNKSFREEVQIYDVFGKLVRTSQIGIAKGITDIRIEKENLSPGIYYVKFAGMPNVMEKIMVIH
jgi:hypothetical protein